MIIFILQIGLFLLITTSIVFYIACALCTLQFTSKKDEFTQINEPVSILIPVCGLDSAAKNNWISFCQQSYPEYEVLFGVKDPQDEAIPVLKEIVEQFSNKVRLFYELEPKGINHQISNLMYLLEAAKYEIIILADSDIRVTPDYLATVTKPLANSEIGVITCGYIDHNPKFIGAALAALGRCIDFLPSVLIARFLDKGMRFALGPTIVTRKSVIKKFGGLKQVVNRIGSDYNIGKMATEVGYRVELSEYILDNDCSEDSLWQVFKRELRWARTIRLNRGLEYYGLIFTYGTVYVVLLLLISNFAWSAIIITSIFLFVRTLQVLIAIYRFKCLKLIYWLWLLPTRDIMSFTIWLIGTFGKRVYWRGRWLEVGQKGLLTEK